MLVRLQKAHVTPLGGLEGPLQDLGFPLPQEPSGFCDGFLVMNLGTRARAQGLSEEFQEIVCGSPHTIT